jgi:hypothetical protein
VVFLSNNVACGRLSVAHSLVPFWPIWPGGGNDRRKPFLAARFRRPRKAETLEKRVIFSSLRKGAQALRPAVPV